MSFLLNRMFLYLTLLSYLVVGTVIVRVYAPETMTVSIATEYLRLGSNTSFQVAKTENLVAPELSFQEIRIVEEKAPAVKIAKAASVETPRLNALKLAKNVLPFHEPVVIKSVILQNDLFTNLVSLYQDFSYEDKEVMLAEENLKIDEVSTKLSKTNSVPEQKTEEADPTFFEYESKEQVKNPETEKIVADQEITATAPVEDISASAIVEEIAVDDLITFDYSKAKQDIKEQVTPTVGVVTTQKIKTGITGLEVKTSEKVKKTNSVKQEALVEEEGLVASDIESKAKSIVTTHQSRVTIQAVASDLKQSNPEAGFEIRFQDDLSETYQDYNTGAVTLDLVLNSASMTRSTTILKRGYAPTNTDLMLESGVTEVSLPLIEENTFNNLMQPYEGAGPVGALLVELDDETEGALIDVPFAKIINLDGDLKETDGSDFRYQLFLGVKVGNALLKYNGIDGEIASKIIHVHEREVTFEANIFEENSKNVVVLYEEDLLGKEKAPLIIASTQVKQFASEKHAKKVNNHSYKMDYAKKLLGSRMYLELMHQNEPIFAGFRENAEIKVPSESFMRYILSRFENSELGNRCLIQVNLNKKASKVDVAPEASGAGLSTSTQVLDVDGKFYDSVGDKSEKIIIVGENENSEEYGHDAKVNLKITYQDGSVEFFGSYCSPNTYLVEQL